MTEMRTLRRESLPHVIDVQRQCEECGKRKAIFIRRPKKYKGTKDLLIVKSDKNHAMCIRCANEQYQKVMQEQKNGIRS